MPPILVGLTRFIINLQWWTAPSPTLHNLEPPAEPRVFWIPYGETQCSFSVGRLRVSCKSFCTRYSEWFVSERMFQGDLLNCISRCLSSQWNGNSEPDITISGHWWLSDSWYLINCKKQRKKDRNICFRVSNKDSPQQLRSDDACEAN